MGAKYSIASDTTAADRLLFVGQNAIHLSTGDCVMMVEDPGIANPGKVSLVLVTGAARGTQTTIATLNASTGTGATFLLNHALPQCLALCRDASDNLYVIGAYGGSTPRLLVFQAFIKQAGLVWQPGVANTCSTAVSANIAPVGYVALWCNTGGGTRYPALTGSPAGHIIVAATTNDGTVTNACYILDAGKVLVGASHAGSVTTNPAFLGDSSTLYGSNLDLAADGFGATRGMAISASGTTAAQLGGWGVSATGTLTTGDGTLLTTTTATLSVTTKLRVAHLNTGAWIVAYPSSVNAGQISVGVVSGGTLSPLTDSGTASNFPTPGATLSWDLSTDPQLNAWVYGWSGQASHRDDMLRVPISFVTFPGVLGAVVTDETAVGGTGASADNTTIRTVKEPVDWFHADWQAYDVTTPFSLQGDYSVFPVTPNVPTLVTPTNNSAAPLASGGTFDWNFTSPEAGDAQVTYYFRRHNASGYQWWNGSSFTAAQAGATGGSEVAVTSGTTLVTFGAGLWAAGAWTWTVQTTGASGVVSGYAPEWVINVAAQPATPTLAGSYDGANNRATLVVTGTGTDDAWFQYSDDGANWFNVRGATAVAQVAGSATVYDWEIPANAPRQYRVLQWDPSSSVLGNLSNWSATQTVTSSVTKFWLSDPQSFSPGINPHVLRGTLDTSFGEVMTEHNPLGRQDTIIVADVVGLEDGACTFATYSGADENALLPLLKSQRVLQLRTPDGRSWFIRWNVARPVSTPYVVATGSYREHAVSWRGSQRPPA